MCRLLLPEMLYSTIILWFYGHSFLLTLPWKSGEERSLPKSAFPDLKQELFTLKSILLPIVTGQLVLSNCIHLCFCMAAHPQEQSACLRGRFPGKMQLFTQLGRNEYYLCPLQLPAYSSTLWFGDNWLCWVTWLLSSGYLRSLACLGLRSAPALSLS